MADIFIYILYLTDFKMAAVAILNLVPVSFFVIWLSLGGGCGCSCKISAIYLLNFVKKKQNGGCRYHELLFGKLWSLDHSKFHVNCVTAFRDMVI